MKTLKKIGIILLIIIGLFLVISLFLPSKVHVERSIVMNAPAENIYEQVNTLKNWEKWSPWHELDPNMGLKYEGPESGVGAQYSWTSEQDNVGNGRLIITASAPDDSIVTEMYFMDSKEPAYATYKFEKADGGTKVTWGMDMDMGMNPIGKFFGLMMDKMVGADFEKGLNNMKTVAESMPVKPKMKIEATTISGQVVLTIRDTCPSSEISKTLGSLYGEISMYMDQAGLKQVSQPFSIYHNYTPETTDMEAGIPIDKMGKNNGRIKAWEIPAGNVVIADYYGPYEGSEAAHAAIDEWVKVNGKTVTGAPWEVYVTDPGREKDPSKWLTQVVYPIQ